KLDMYFTLILIIAGIITFLPACFVYWRIMKLASFQKQYLIKLFVLNGVSNMLIYMVNLVAVQFCNWPSVNGVFSWFNETLLPVIFQFLMNFASCVMWQTTFLISLNRVLSLHNQYFLSKNDYQYFLLALLSSLSASFIICFPLFFSRAYYKAV
ncbi:hypothetical protein PENTCL1PPCAC_12930, partial [Pristionchus entomophagus]